MNSFNITSNIQIIPNAYSPSERNIKKMEKGIITFMHEIIQSPIWNDIAGLRDSRWRHDLHDDRLCVCTAINMCAQQDELARASFRSQVYTSSTYTHAYISTQWRAWQLVTHRELKSCQDFEKASTQDPPAILIIILKSCKKNAFRLRRAPSLKSWICHW